MSQAYCYAKFCGVDGDCSPESTDWTPFSDQSLLSQHETNPYAPGCKGDIDGEIELICLRVVLPILVSLRSCLVPRLAGFNF